MDFTVGFWSDLPRSDIWLFFAFSCHLIWSDDFWKFSTKSDHNLTKCLKFCDLPVSHNKNLFSFSFFTCSTPIIGDESTKTKKCMLTAAPPWGVYDIIQQKFCTKATLSDGKYTRVKNVNLIWSDLTRWNQNLIRWSICLIWLPKPDSHKSH